MFSSLPSFILGFHGCDKKVGLQILNGHSSLRLSNNPWDWLGKGMYFWEHDPTHTLQYAIEVSEKEQFAKGKIETPFVLGAVIDLKNCWNLPTDEGVKLLESGYNGLQKSTSLAGTPMPENKGFAIRNLDCAVIEYIHQINDDNNIQSFDSVRGAFQKGNPVYPSTTITQQNHIQICVRNPECVKGYFLPQPLKKYNPFLNI